MADWQILPLGKCLDGLLDYRGKSPPKSADGIPVLSAKVVKTSGLIRPIEQKISPTFYPIWMTRGLPKIGDVVLTTEGPMGEVIQLDAETVRYALGQRLVCLRGKTGVLDNTFLRYLLISPAQQNILLSYATGTTVLGISQAALRSVPIRFPKEIEIQQELANVLVALDDKIELNRGINETLEGIAQAIFNDWFVDFGPMRRKLAGATDPVAIMGGLTPDVARATHLAALFPDAFDDDLPLGWSRGKLEDLAFSAGAVVQPSSVRSDTPYIGLEHMPRRTIMLAEWGTAASVTSAKVAFKRGQILFGKLRPYFHKVGIAPTAGVASTDIVVIDARSSFDRALVACIASSDSFVAYTDLGSDGTKMPRTSWSKMSSYPIVIAGHELRIQFSDLIQAMHEKLLASIDENRTLAETRDYLLPKLMSGEVRVRDAEKLAESALA